MPHTKSAKKRIVQSEARRVRNRAVLRSIKSYLKRVETTAQAGDLEALRKACSEAARKIDQAAAKGVIHRNNAARRKSHLDLLLGSKQRHPAATATS